MLQTTEQDKTSGNKTKQKFHKMELTDLPDKEFKVMVIQMLTRWEENG